MDKPIECLLRSPIELASAVSYFGVATVAGLAPELMFMPAVLGATLAAGFATRGVLRFHQGFRLIRYQQNLRVLPTYTMAQEAVPHHQDVLLIGKGFEWTAKHTQRRADTRKRENEHYVKDGVWYKTARRLIDAVGNTPCRCLTSPFNVNSMLNPVRPRPYVEGDSTLHSVGLYEREENITLRQGERVAHHFAVGTTRVGKTTLLIQIATQDIFNNDIVIIIDPKGDPELLARTYAAAKAAGRLNDLTIFHLGFPALSARYNPIADFGRVTEVAGRIAGQLPSEGSSAAFREFAWRYINVIAKACTAIGKKMTYEHLLEYGANLDPLLTEYLSHVFEKEELDDWKGSVANVIASQDKMPRHMQDRDREAWAHVQVYNGSGIRNVTAKSLIHTYEQDQQYYGKLVASLFPLLEKMTTGKTAALLSPDYEDLDDERPVFDWMQVIRNRRIVYIGLDALSDPDVAAAVGNAMFADLTSTAGQLYKHGREAGLPEVEQGSQDRPAICIHCDEFSDLVGKEFIPMANKAGGAGFQLTVYTQTLSDIVAKTGSQAVAGQVVGNLGTLTMLRVKEHATAELLTSQLDDVEINELMIESGATDSSNPDNDIHFVSNTRQRITAQRVPMIHPGDVMKLPKGHAFALIGGRLFKVRLPIFTQETALPEHIRFMVGKMREVYATANPHWRRLSPLAFTEVA